MLRRTISARTAPAVLAAGLGLALLATVAPASAAPDTSGSAASPAPAASAAAPAARGTALPVVLDDRRIDDEGFRIAACRAGRCWLEFASITGRRRLRLVPPRWYTLSPAALALLCEEAEVIES